MHLAKPLAVGPLVLGLPIGAVAPLPDEVTATGNSCVNDVDGLVAGATGYHDSRSTEIPPVTTSRRAGHPGVAAPTLDCEAQRMAGPHPMKVR